MNLFNQRIDLILLVVVAITTVLALAESCDNEKCGWGSTCKLINGRPRCKCNEYCPMVQQPICGSDGKTYTNYCGMKQAGCHQQEEIVKVHDGACPKIVAVGSDSDDGGDSKSYVGDQDSEHNNTEEISLVPEELKKQQQKP